MYNKEVPYGANLVDTTQNVNDGQYFFGEDIIFAPIVNKGQTIKQVYIPGGEWRLMKDKKIHTKGMYEISAQIDEFVAFVKVGSKAEKLIFEEQE
jgi:alpha-glucosidase (family GH31 glycosyl hydrolase)